MSRIFRVLALSAVLFAAAGFSSHGDSPGPRHPFLVVPPPLPPPPPPAMDEEGIIPFIAPEEPIPAAAQAPDAAPSPPAAIGEQAAQPVDRQVSPPLAYRYIVEMDPCPPPTPSELRAEEKIGAGPVVRFYTRGSRVEESESFRRELRELPLGHEWPWYQQRLGDLGFIFIDATWSATERPRYALQKDGLLFQMEIRCDGAGRVIHIDAGPNL